MKKLLSLLVVVPALGLLSLSSGPAGLPIGSPLPKADIPIKDVSGKMITLGEAKGANGLLVMFSCNTCPYVIRNQSRTKAVCGYAGDHKIGVVLLNANAGDRDDGNSFEAMQAYAKGQDYGWYYALDDKSVLADAFGASRTPECFLFDKNGKLVYHGAIDDSPGDPGRVGRHHLQIAIDEMLAGKEVSVKETRSVGCSINRGA
ncbi:MAG TPA: thioredoxin family protein [Puia sp.]|nr:thioredoxin family protein [Puia sp.]